MAVTANLIKELRAITGAGMSDCKKALVETDGNIETAIDYLREKGLAAAAKKAGRIASEGLVSVLLTEDNKKGVVVEVNSETDFVAKNEIFQKFVAQVAEHALNTTSTDVENMLTEKFVGENGTVQEALNDKILVIGENLSIRRFTKFEAANNGTIVSYVHGAGKVVVMIEFVSDAAPEKLAECGKNVCMQIAAMSPKFVDSTSMPAEYVEKEKEILMQQAINEGKDAAIVEKMVVGRLKKQLKEVCLVEQEYVKDGDMSILQYIESVAKEVGSPITVARFVRFETGEGIEKKEENFADEVNKAMQV